MLRVLHYVSVMDRGGQETFIMNLFQEIDRSRIQFDFLCGENRPGEFDEEIYSLGGHIFYAKPVTVRNQLKHLQSVLLLSRQLKEMPYDVFHIHTHHAFSAVLSAAAAKLAGIKTVVVHSHNTSAQYHLRAHELSKKLLARMNIRRFACSQAAGEWMFGDSGFTVIHNGVDVDKFCFDPQEHDAVRKEMGWENKKIIGHIGRFNGQKNHLFLIEIFAELHARFHDAHLVLVGKGELEEEVRKRVEEKGLSDAVSFLGVRSDVQRLYQGMDLLLFPSLFEGLSVVLVEAQASGLPCLISDTITPENVFIENVRQKPLEDPASSWAEECKQLLESAEERKDTREELRNAGYDMKDLANKLQEIYLA